MNSTYHQFIKKNGILTAGVIFLSFWIYFITNLLKTWTIETDTSETKEEEKEEIIETKVEIIPEQTEKGSNCKQFMIHKLPIELTQSRKLQKSII
jgi:hypothetical protein